MYDDIPIRRRRGPEAVQPIPVQPPKDDGVPIRQSSPKRKGPSLWPVVYLAFAVAFASVVGTLVVSRLAKTQDTKPTVASEPQKPQPQPPSPKTQAPLPQAKVNPTPKPSLPSTVDDGQKWNHKELVAYLKSVGLSVWLYRPEEVLSADQIVPSMVLLPRERKGKESADAVILCMKHPSEQAARDYAGTEKMAFYWGRFSFRTARPDKAVESLYGDIAKALGVKPY